MHLCHSPWKRKGFISISRNVPDSYLQLQPQTRTCFQQWVKRRQALCPAFWEISTILCGSPIAWHLEKALSWKMKSGDSSSKSLVVTKCLCDLGQVISPCCVHFAPANRCAWTGQFLWFPPNLRFCSWQKVILLFLWQTILSFSSLQLRVYTNAWIHTQGPVHIATAGHQGGGAKTSDLESP